MNKYIGTTPRITPKFKQTVKEALAAGKYPMEIAKEIAGERDQPLLAVTFISVCRAQRLISESRSAA